MLQNNFPNEWLPMEKDMKQVQNIIKSGIYISDIEALERKIRSIVVEDNEKMVRMLKDWAFDEEFFTTQQAMNN